MTLFKGFFYQGFLEITLHISQFSFLILAFRLAFKSFVVTILLYVFFRSSFVVE